MKNKAGYTVYTVMTWGNPYTHEEHSRTCIPNLEGHKKCDWCGNNPKRLFKYDGDIHRFCNKICYKDYHY